MKDSLNDGTKNILRFGMDSLSLECPSPLYTVSRANNAMRRIAQTVIEKTGIHLKWGARSRVQFSYDKSCAAHEDCSYWGVLGFGLAIPLLFLIIFLRREHRNLLVFAAASWIFILCQAFCGPYDPWRGRYFIQLAPFAMPLLSLVWGTRQQIVKWYLVVVVVIACGTAICAIMFRSNRPLISIGHHMSMFRQTRLQQLTANRPYLLDDVQNYEAMVPSSAIVGVRFPDDMYEFPLFGEGLTRTVIPFPYTQQVDTKVDYIVYSKGVTAERWIVRKLGNQETANKAFEAIGAEAAPQPQR